MAATRTALKKEQMFSLRMAIYFPVNLGVPREDEFSGISNLIQCMSGN